MRRYMVLAMVAACAAPLKAQEARLHTTYGNREKSVYATVWQTAPSVPIARIGVVYDGPVSAILHLPAGFKIAGARVDDRDDIGVYWQRSAGNAAVGAGVERLGERWTAEGHLRWARRPVLLFTGLGTVDNKPLAMAGGFLDIGRYHGGASGALRSDTLALPFGGRRQVLAYAAVDGITKIFYRTDGTYHRLNGFVRFGTHEARRYTPNAFVADRQDFSESLLRLAPAEEGDIPLIPSNTHLSDHGTCALGGRYEDTPHTETLTMDGYCTAGQAIAGYGFAWKKTQTVSRSHTVPAGVNFPMPGIGPGKLVAGWNTAQGWSGDLWITRPLGATTRQKSNQ